VTLNQRVQGSSPCAPTNQIIETSAEISSARVLIGRAAPTPVIYDTAEVVPRLLSITAQIRDNSMIRLTWQEYFEQFIRPRLRDLAARQASGRELTERLRAIAADYKLFLFDDNSRS
jgi:hypothetical protein